MNKKIHVLGYATTRNLGDEIQSLGAINTLKRIGYKHAGFIDRDNPQAPENSSSRANLLVNGFIPDNSMEMRATGINLIYNNYHMDSTDESTLPKRIELLRQHQPIGCRDRYTTELFKQAGVDAFFNYCLTLMLDRRKKPPINGKVFLVDLSKYMYLPRSIKRLKPEVISQRSREDFASADRFQRAQELLDLYKNKARLVITSRLHCALPCVAMGIPVIFLGLHDYHRLALAEELIPLYKFERRSYSYQEPVNQLNRSLAKAKYHLTNNMKLALATYSKKIDWDPQPLDIGNIQEKILKATKEQILRFT